MQDIKVSQFECFFLVWNKHKIIAGSLLLSKNNKLLIVKRTGSFFVSLFLLSSRKTTDRCPVKWFGNIFVTRLDKATHTNKMIKDYIFDRIFLNRFCRTCHFILYGLTSGNEFSIIIYCFFGTDSIKYICT